MPEPQLDADGEALRGLALFSQLSVEQVRQVAGGARRAVVSRAEAVVNAGDPCAEFFCVLRGQVKLTLSTADGAEKILEIISAGETFGEAVMFAGRPYPVTATALVATTLLVVPAETVFDLVHVDPMFARRMLAGMSMRLHALINEVGSISLRSGSQRVVGLLLSLAGGAALPGQLVELPAGKAVLASRLNLTPETFSRALRDLSSDGLISVSGRLITLIDPPGLTARLG